MISPEQLRRYPFFSGMTPDHLRGIAMISEEVSYPPETLIFSEGEEARYLYVLVSGGVELLYSGNNVGEIADSYVGSIVQGEVFGISSMVGPFHLTASAKSEGTVGAIRIEAAGLRAMCEVDHGLGYILMQHLAQALTQRLHEVRVQLAACKPA
jgi:CRP-like cAMP-binding protein